MLRLLVLVLHPLAKNLLIFLDIITSLMRSSLCKSCQKLNINIIFYIKYTIKATKNTPYIRCYLYIELRYLFTMPLLL
jgi:hypothetical protein